MTTTTKRRRSGADEKVQLRHPEGKKAVRISRKKYDLLRASLLRVLRQGGSGTHAELGKAVSADLKARSAAFEGSVQWHLEWVKLDLEARGELERVAGSSPQQFRRTGAR